jgi:hypothetical protein
LVYQRDDLTMANTYRIISQMDIVKFLLHNSDKLPLTKKKLCDLNMEYEEVITVNEAKGSKDTNNIV